MLLWKFIVLCLLTIICENSLLKKIPKQTVGHDNEHHSRNWSHSAPFPAITLEGSSEISQMHLTRSIAMVRAQKSKVLPIPHFTFPHCLCKKSKEEKEKLLDTTQIVFIIPLNYLCHLLQLQHRGNEFQHLRTTLLLNTIYFLMSLTSALIHIFIKFLTLSCGILILTKCIVQYLLVFVFCLYIVFKFAIVAVFALILLPLFVVMDLSFKLMMQLFVYVFLLLFIIMCLSFRMIKQICHFFFTLIVIGMKGSVQCLCLLVSMSRNTLSCAVLVAIFILLYACVPTLCSDVEQTSITDHSYASAQRDGLVHFGFQFICKSAGSLLIRFPNEDEFVSLDFVINCNIFYFCVRDLVLILKNDFGLTTKKQDEKQAINKKVFTLGKKIYPHMKTVLHEKGKNVVYVNDEGLAFIVFNEMKGYEIVESTKASYHKAIGFRWLSLSKLITYEHLSKFIKKNTTVDPGTITSKEGKHQMPKKYKNLLTIQDTKCLKKQYNMNLFKQLAADLESIQGKKKIKGIIFTAERLIELDYLLKNAAKYIKQLLLLNHFYVKEKTKQDFSSFNFKDNFSSTLPPLKTFINRLIPVGARNDHLRVFATDYLCRLCHTNVIPDSVLSLGIFFQHKNGLRERMDILSKFRITPSSYYINSILKTKSVEFHAKFFIPDDASISVGVDNVQQRISVNKHKVGQSDCNMVHGVNVVEAIYPPEDPSLSQNSIQPKSLPDNFVNSTKVEKNWCDFYKLSQYALAAAIVQMGESPQLPCLADVAPEFDSNDTQFSNLLKKQFQDIIHKFYFLFFSGDGGSQCKLRSPTLIDHPDDATISWQGKTKSRLADIIIGKSEDRKLLQNLCASLKSKYINPHRQHIFLTMDEKLYEIIQQFKEVYPNDFNFINLLLDPFHCNWTMDKAIYGKFKYAGLREMLGVIGYLLDSQFEYLSTCNDIHRSHYVLEEVALAVRCETFSLYLASLEKEDQDHFRNLDDSEINNWIHQHNNDFTDWKNKTAATNMMFHLWAVLFDEVSLISCANWDAQRTGNWPLYLSTLKFDTGFTPFFFAWNRNKYSHSSIEQIRDAHCLSPYDQACIQDGIAFMNIRGTDFNYMSVGNGVEHANRKIKQATLRNDLAGGGWQRNLHKMPLIDENEANIKSNINSDDHIANQSRKRTPCYQHISYIRALIKHHNILKMDYTSGTSLHNVILHNWFSDEKLEKKFLTSQSVGLTPAFQLAEIIVQNNKTGSTKTIKNIIKDQIKTVSPLRKNTTTGKTTQIEKPTKITKKNIYKEQKIAVYQDKIPYCFTDNGIKPASCSKSITRSMLYEIWPACEEKVSSTEVVLCDAMPLFFRRPPESVSSLPAYVLWFVQKFVKPFVTEKDTAYFVLVVDKPVFEHIVKGYTQNVTRKQNKVSTLDLIRTFDNSPIASGTKMPKWDWIVGSRSVRYELIYLFFQELLLHPDIYLPKGSYNIVLDGHQTQVTREISFEPICLTCTLNNPVKRTEMPNMKNSQAEADQAIYFYIDYFLASFSNFLILCEDSDFTHISLLLFNTFKEKNVNVKLFLGNSSKNMETRKFVNIGQMHNSIQMDARLHRCNFPVASVVFCSIMSGSCDYNGSIYGFGPRTFLHVFLEYFREDLVTDELIPSAISFDIIKNAFDSLPKPSFERYRLFLKTLYIFKYRAFFKDVVFPKPADVTKWKSSDVKSILKHNQVKPAGSKIEQCTQLEALFAARPDIKGQHLESCVSIRTPTGKESTVSLPEEDARARIWLENREPKYWIPQEEPMHLHFLRSSFCFLIWLSSPSPLPSVPQNDEILSWGYTKIDAESPLSAKNVCYFFGNNSTNTESDDLEEDKNKKKFKRKRECSVISKSKGTKSLSMNKENQSDQDINTTPKSKNQPKKRKLQITGTSGTLSSVLKMECGKRETFEITSVNNNEQTYINQILKDCTNV